VRIKSTATSSANVDLRTVRSTLLAETIMKVQNRILAIEQLDNKLSALKPLVDVAVPGSGWLNAIRLSLHMSLRQLAKRLNVSIQSMKEIEDREASDSITLKNLREAAAALDMNLVYALVPREESLEKKIENQAGKVARTIVLRTAGTMELEDQEVSDKRIEKAIRSKTEELIRTMPRYLWD
jgi:predicted DNA-binding mobile mystery protein A